MAIDPKVEAALLAIESQLDKVDDIVSNIQGQVTEVRRLSSGNPPDPITTPITVTASATRTSATTVAVAFVIGGTLSRATKAATIISTDSKSWKEWPAPSQSSGTLNITVSSATGAAAVFFHVWDSGLKNGAGDWVIAKPSFEAWKGEPPPPPPPGTGKFTFDGLGGNLSLFKDGKLFIPRGFNIPGPNGYFGGGYTPVGKATTLRNDWKVNLIRLFEQDSTGGECSACPSAHNPWSIDDVVKEYTAQGIVVMIDYHQFDFGRTYGPEQTTKMINFWTPLATRYKDNPLVWFNLANEPENDGGGTNTPAMADRWYNAFAPVVKVIRDIGATNMIVVDDGNAGQGCSDYFKIGPSTGSAIMLRGRDLLASDPTGNMMWDMHCYDNMGWSSPGEANNDCSNRYTDAQRDARFIDYVKRIWNATGRPVLIGECGWRATDQKDSGAGFHYPYTTCGSRTYKGQQAFTRNGVALNTGGTQWTGFQISFSGTDAYASTNLTACGIDWWAFCQAAAIKESTSQIAEIMADSQRSLFDKTAIGGVPGRRPTGVTVNDEGEAIEIEQSDTERFSALWDRVDLLNLSQPRRKTTPAPGLLGSSDQD